MLFTALTLGAGFKGGEIVPIFFTGATFGCVAAPLLGLPPQLGAAQGMVALFCGCTNSPLASICLAIEVFGGQCVSLFQPLPRAALPAFQAAYRRRATGTRPLVRDGRRTPDHKRRRRKLENQKIGCRNAVFML